MPNPLETPPMLAEGAIGIVGGDFMSKQSKFDDNTITNANGATATAPPAETKNDGEQSTTQKDEPKVYTPEELSSMIDDVLVQLKTLSDRLNKLDGTNDAGTTNTEASTTTETPAPTDKPVESKMSKEIQIEVDKQLKEYLEKNSPAKLSNKFESDDYNEKPIDDITSMRVRQLEIERNKKK